MKLHKTMMEEVLYGCDVMPSAGTHHKFYSGGRSAPKSNITNPASTPLPMDDRTTAVWH